MGRGTSSPAAPRTAMAVGFWSTMLGGSSSGSEHGGRPKPGSISMTLPIAAPDPARRTWWPSIAALDKLKLVDGTAARN